MKKSLRLLPSSWVWFFSAAVVSVASAFSDAEWKFQQAFTLEHSGVWRIAVPLETLDHAQPDLRDLRIAAADGAEVPFALVRPLSAPAQWRPAEKFNVALQEGVTVVTVEAKENKAWEAIDFAVSTPVFLKAAQVEASVDGKTWERWEDGVPLFRKDGAVQTTLILRKQPARFYRVTLNDRRQSPIIVTGARIREPADEQISLEPVAVRIAHTEDYANESALTLVFPAANLDLDSLEIRTAENLFTRQVRAGLRQFKDGEIEERILASDTLFRVKLDDNPPAEKLRAALVTALPSRELVFHIENGDSPPLRIEEIKASRRLVYLAFEARAPGRYLLWSGNPQANAPRYDLSLMADPLRRVPTSSVAFDAGATNPNYHHADPLAGLSLLGATVKLADWSVRRPVRLENPGVQQLELDLAALNHADHSLADLRLVRGEQQVPYILERTGLWQTVDLAVTADPDSKNPNSSRWRVRLPYPGAPIAQLALSSPTALFQRDLRIFEHRATTNGETYEAELGHATWQRTPQDKPSPLVIALTAPQSSQFWIQTHNGDNPAISLDRVRAYHRVNRLLFRTESTEGLTLLSGNREAAAPRYDVSLVAQTLLASEKQIATLAPANDAEFHDEATGALPMKTALFWGALALVVVALLVVVAKLLPKPPGPK